MFCTGLSPSEKVWGEGFAVNCQICFSRMGVWIIIERRTCEFRRNEENHIRNKWIMCQGSCRWRTIDNHPQSATYEVLSQRKIKTGMKRFRVLRNIWRTWAVDTTLQLCKFKAKKNGGSAGLRQKSFVRWSVGMQLVLSGGDEGSSFLLHERTRQECYPRLKKLLSRCQS